MLKMSASNSGSFVEVFLSNAEKHREKPLYSYLDANGKIESAYTYGEFDEATKNLAQTIKGEWGIQRGESVLLVYPPGLDFIVTFVACLRAGVVAVPVYPPHPNKRKDMNMFVSVQSSCKAKTVLTNSAYSYAKKISALSSMFSKNSPSKMWPDMKWIITNNIKANNSPKTTLETSKETDLAFLQYTSGSTSDPKGVMLSQKNLAFNLTAIINALEADDSTVVVSWLPQYHDMGLIGSYLGIAYCGGSGYYMSPFSFIKSPVMWVKTLSKYGATHIQAPNFAYKLTVRKWNDYISKHGNVADLDLSKLRHIFNAAEPVDVTAIDLFNETFAQYGLSPDAMSPGYGLAENTVYVCDAGKGRLRVDKELMEAEDRIVEISSLDDKQSVMLAGCGNPHRLPENGIKVCIVDKDCKTVNEDMVGEIWVASPSKTDGYFGLEEKSKKELHAKLTTEDDSLSTLEWLRTGDLGFMHDNELYVCGRIKDLIIIRGRNHFPQDIELSLENSDISHLKPGCSAAFTIAHPSNGEEVLVVVAEVRNGQMDYNDVITNIRKAIFSDHGLVPFSIVLIEERSINKTTSGKIQRHRVCLSFKSKTLTEKHRWESGRPTSDVAEEENGSAAKASSENQVKVQRKANSGEQPKGAELLNELKEEVGRLLLQDTDQINSKLPLIELGMDSLSISQLKGLISSNYNVEIDEALLFDEKTSLEIIQKVIEDGPEAAAALMEQNQQNQQLKPIEKKKKKKKKAFFMCG